MILGLTGTIGAGKGTVVDYLVKEKGFAHYSMRGAIVEDIKRLGIPVDRTSMNEVATQMRREHGGDYYTERFFERAQEEGNSHFIIESVRQLDEARNIKKHGGYLLVVDAPETVRYDRIKGRGTETDQVTFEEFRAQEAREMTSENPEDSAHMDMRGVIGMADATIVNDGTLEELHARIEEALAKLV